jgi:hypothetical protein
MNHNPKKHSRWWTVRPALFAALAVSLIALITLISQPRLVDQIAGRLSAMTGQTHELVAK